MCPIGAYREWRNALYRAGYTGSLVQKGDRRLLILEDLEAAAGQYFWKSAFGTSSQERIAKAKAMAQVSLNHRIPMGLLPKPVPPSHYAHPPSGKRALKVLKQNEIPAKAALSKADLKRQRKEDLLKNPKNAHK